MGPKGRYFASDHDKPGSHTCKGEGWKNRQSEENEKGGEEEKLMAELSVLILATFLNRKLALLDKKRCTTVFGGNVLINPALYAQGQALHPG